MKENVMERIVTLSPYPCEIYHEVVDTLLYAHGVRRQIEHHHMGGVGITTIVDGFMGFASTDTIEGLEESYDLSKKFAHHSSRSRVLPQSPTLSSVCSCFDPRIAEASQTDVADLAEGIRAVVPPTCDLVSETILLKKRKVHIMNSNGMNVTRKSTYAVLDITLREKALGLDLFSYFYSRKWDISWLLSEEIELWQENSRKQCDIAPGEYEVIFSPAAISRILDAIFVPAICGMLPEVCDRISSPELLPPWLEIYDDGTLEGGMGTEPFDDEGVAQQKTHVIEKGCFASILCDTTLARAYGKKSTGNSVRESFGNAPVVYVTNLIISPVSGTEELINEIVNGIVIDDLMGAYTVNPPSGDITSTVWRGYRIQKGEIVGAIPPREIQGNIFSLFKDFMPGNDVKRVDRYVVPSIKTRIRIC